VQPQLAAADAAMRAAYGFGLFAPPRYRDARIGEWEIARYGPAWVEGYCSGSRGEPFRHVLRERRTPWMSSSQFELESQCWHLACAHGTVVVLGLGLGLFVHAAAAKPEVERLIVVERAAEVVELLHAAADFGAWPGHEKIAVLQADALADGLPARIAALGGARADYLYADIWPRSPAPEAPATTTRLAAALDARAAGFWSQEVSFALWARGHRRAAELAALQEYFAGYGLPVPVTEGYARFCADVIAREPSAQPKSWLSRLLGRG
jgi:hypothetical protein